MTHKFVAVEDLVENRRWKNTMGKFSPAISQLHVNKVKLELYHFFLFGGILGSASRAEFPVSLSNYVGFTPRLLYSSTHYSSESFIPLKTD